MKKWDYIVILSVTTAALLVFLCISFLGNAGKTVTVSQNNSVVYEGKLSEDKELRLNTNTVIIKDGEASMSYSSCKNQICTNHRHISKKGESIICLPNKVIIEIK